MQLASHYHFQEIQNSLLQITMRCIQNSITMLIINLVTKGDSTEDSSLKSTNKTHNSQEIDVYLYIGGWWT